MIKYYYELPATNKIILDKNDKICFEDATENILILYELNVYIYPNNNYTNDGIDINRDAMCYSPEWFIITNSKKDIYTKKNKIKKNKINIDLDEIENN